MSELLNRGKIENSGCGGFLNPPTHPEHNYSVRNLYGGDKNYFLMSLSGALDCEWLDEETKTKAKKILDTWQAPSIDDEEIQDWIHQMLGYFRNCYTRDKSNRSVNDAKTFYISENPDEPLDHHLGVLMIQEYYPTYTPKQVDFDNAYWGKKIVK